MSRHGQKPVMVIVAKYAMGKWLVGLVILKNETYSEHGILTGLKIGPQVLLRRREGPMVKLYVSQLLIAKCVTRNKAQ